MHYIGEWESGDSAAFNQMYNYFRTTDFTALPDYQGGAALWDPVNAADYYIVNAWGATKDWPGNNYTSSAASAPPGKKWRFSMWDAEGAMGMFGQPNTANTFTEDLMTTTPASETFIMRMVFQRFNQNPEWKLLFADRLQKHFFNGGVMQQATGQARWNSLRDQVKPAIQAIQGSAYYEGHWTNWLNRTPTFLDPVPQHGLWPVTVAPGMTPFGGTIQPGKYGHPHQSQCGRHAVRHHRRQRSAACRRRAESRRRSLQHAHRRHSAPHYQGPRAQRHGMESAHGSQLRPAAAASAHHRDQLQPARPG